MIIKGNTVGTPMPRANFDQTDEKKADYIKGRDKLLSRDELNSAIDTALATAKESGKFDGKDGNDGKDGTNGTNGKDGKDGTNGKDGVNGKDGYTPQKNVDYFTEADKVEMVQSVINALPKYNGEVVTV